MAKMLYSWANKTILHSKTLLFVSILFCSNIFMFHCLLRSQLRKQASSCSNGATWFLKASSRNEPVTGIIIIDHGSRRREANDMLNLVVERFKERSPFTIVEAAHMELAEPSIAAAFEKCVQQGATRIVCHPLFLARGRHVQEDIPALVSLAAAAYKDQVSECMITEPLGLQLDEVAALVQSSVITCLDSNNNNHNNKIS